MTDPEMTQIPQAAKPRLSRRIKLLLVTSLTVNVLLIGILVGGVMRFSQFEPMIPGQPDLRSLWHALPDTAQRDLRAMSRERGFPGDHGPRPTREERRARMQAANSRILELLRAQPFDEAAFAEVISGERAAFERRLNAARTAFAAQVAELSDAEREAMADRLEDAFSRPPRWH